jgi:ribosomal protein L12E/L44/L45/RPP1/RPP2
MLQGEEKVLQGLPAIVMEELEKESSDSSDAPRLVASQLTEGQEGRAVEDEKEEAREEEEEEEEEIDEDEFSLISDN